MTDIIPKTEALPVNLFNLFSTGCTYCFLKAINETVAKSCPVHGVLE